MSILLSRESRVCIQGISGTGGRFHARSMSSYGTNVVAGVSPGHGSETIEGIPVFDTCHEAASETGGIDYAVTFVGGSFVLDAIYEAIDAGARGVVCMTEEVPVLDSLRAKAYCVDRGAVLIGPNTNGIISMGKAKIGFFPREFDFVGPVGILSRSGTLAYGAMMALQQIGLGQSTVVGIGGGLVRGLGFADGLEMFASDPETAVVVVLGEIGGREEERAAEFYSANYAKPVVALIAGQTAPVGVSMGHAGAIMSSSGGWDQKTEALRSAGIDVAHTLQELAQMVALRLRSCRMPKMDSAAGSKK